MKNKNRFLKLACEILCLALTLCIIFGVIPSFATEAGATEEAEATEEEKPATVDIVVAAGDIPQGTRLNNEHVKLVTVFNENVPSNAITDLQQVFDKYSACDLHEGEYVFKEQLSNKRISKTDSDLLKQEIVKTDDLYVVVTDYVKADTGEDLSALLQELIDKNPKRTLYFPDGEYVIREPLRTSDLPGKSVSLHLSDGAVIKAADNWRTNETDRTKNCLISVGGNSTGTSDVVSVGSYYSVIGGTLDGNGKAYGISYTSGRESLIKDVCIKNVKIGIFIPTGVNSGSADADFEDIVIYGTGEEGSFGLLIEGHDNTLTNIRIYNMEVAVRCTAGTSLFKSVYAYNDPALMSNYANTKAFYIGSWGWYTDCVAENFAIGFDVRDFRSVVSDNTVRWTSELCTTQIAVKLGSDYIGLSGIRAEFLPVADPVEIAFVSLLNRYYCANERVHRCSYVYTGNDASKAVCPKCGAEGADSFEDIGGGKYACKTKTIDVCGYMYAGTELPEDLTCPECKNDLHNFKDAGEGKYTCETDHVISCDGIYEGEAADAVCPKCGAEGDNSFVMTEDGKYACKGKIEKCTYVYSGDEFTAETACACDICEKDAHNFSREPLPKTIELCSFDESLVTNKTYEEMLATEVLPLTAKAKD